MITYLFVFLAVDDEAVAIFSKVNKSAQRKIYAI